MFKKEEEPQEEQVEYAPFPAVQQSPYFQPNIMPSEKADLYSKINPSDIIDEMRYKLQGFIYDEKRRTWYKPKDCKGLTEFGANEITSMMLTVSSENVTVSNLKDDEIRMIVRSVNKTVMMSCIGNWREYGITNKDQIYQISQMVSKNTFITLKAVEHAGVREFLGKSSTESKSIVEDNKKGGIFRR